MGQVCENHLGLLALCRVDGVPVSKGADHPLKSPALADSAVPGPRGWGYAELPPTDRQLCGDDAASAWVEAAHQHPGELIGLATGPLTNLALALRKEPALPTLLRRLVIMGGAYDYRGNTSPVAEWNIAVDPEAAAEVFAAWSPSAAEDAVPQHLPILCGLNLTRKISITPDILVRLAAAADSTTTALSVDDERGLGRRRPNPLIRVIEDATRFYLESYHDLRARLSSAPARPIGRGGRAGPAACRHPAGDGGRRIDRRPDPRHDGHRLVGTLGSKAQRADRC